MLKVLTLISFLLVSQSFFSQDEDGSKVKKNTSKTITIDDTDEDVSEDDGSNYEGHNNVIKIQLLDFVKGYALLTYTRAIRDNFSLDASIGITYSPNLLKNFLEISPGLDRGILQSNQFYYPISEISNLNSFLFSGGFMYRLGFKYFYDSNHENDGSYLGVEFGRVSYDFKFTFFNPNSQSSFSNEIVTPFLKTRTTDLRLYWGKHGPFGDTNIYYDFNLSTGVGFRRNDYVYYDYISQSSNDNIDINNPRYSSGDLYSVLRFSLGFAIGYGF